MYIIKSFTKNNIIDELHDVFAFRIDLYINSLFKFKKILRQRKSK